MVPGVITLVTALSTIPLDSLGSEVCSAIAIFNPESTNFFKLLSRE